MKRLLTLLCALLIVTGVSAQRSKRIAVFEFEPGANIEKEMVDGISSIFTTFFAPNGWTCVDRTEIDQIINEQNLQQSKITESQRAKIGRVHNISKMVLGTINIANGQYNVDVRVVDVMTGEISATGGTSVPNKTNYRTAIGDLAKKLAKDVEALPVIESEVRERADVEVVMNYLKVYPEELGEYPYEPKDVIKQINLQHLYDYDSWRIPSDTELALLRNNGYLDEEETYISSSSRTDGIVLLVTDDPETYSQKQARLAHEALKASKRKKDTASAITNNPFTEKPEQPIDALKADMQNIHQQSELTMMFDLDFAIGDVFILGSPSFTIGRTYKERLYLGIGTGYHFDFLFTKKPETFIPIFIHSRFYLNNIQIPLTPNFKGSPYIALSTGVDIINGEYSDGYSDEDSYEYSYICLHLAPALGIDFPLYNKIAFYTSIGPSVRDDEIIFELKIGLRF